MSSVITGERITDMRMPVTWAAFAALVQLVVVCVPALMWAGGVTARVSGLETYRESHKLETVHRTEFERLTSQLDRLETKMDALSSELHRGR